MARLIDADAFTKEIKKLQTYKLHADLEKLIGLHDVLAELRDAPTIDPVRHGRWVRKDNSKNCKRIGDFEEWHECSDCEGNSDYESEYCPDCGARMDGEE